MQALHPRVVDAVWAAVEELLPPVVDDHPLGCHRPRVDDPVCFTGIVGHRRPTGGRVSHDALR